MNRFRLRAWVLLGVLLLGVTFLVSLRAGTDPPAESPETPIAIVERTAATLSDPARIADIVSMYRRAGVQRVWIQFKQDETDEVLGGMVFYPSSIAPVAPGFDDDRITTFIDALTSAGIEAVAWVPCLQDPAAYESHPDWRAQYVTADGVVEERDGWLCPRSEDVVRYESSIVAEITARYPHLKALYTDFMRYDSDFSCTCRRCLKELKHRPGWPIQAGHETTGSDILRAADERGDAWESWTAMRAQSICHVADALRDAISDVRPGMWYGVCVLPFSAGDYSTDTGSGQDLWELARVGLDEIALMGYWDDWVKSPEWLRRRLDDAMKEVEGECKLSCLLDGDMSVRRTWRTLDAIRGWKGDISWFNYAPWTKEDFKRLRRAICGSAEGPLPPADYTSAVIRVDTEPDDAHRYDTVTTAMISKLVTLFDEENIKGTFMTCGRLAELQPEAVLDAYRHGNEIGVHAYDHEQLDELPDDEQILAVDKGLDAVRRLNIPVHGFGSPRNSVTRHVLNELIDRGLSYDGSEAFDPMTSYVDANYVRGGRNRRILQIPYSLPNDYDARRQERISARQMLSKWTQRLDQTASQGEPVFVLDVHQWSITEPDNLDALRQFIRYARGKPGCRVETLEQAALHVHRIIDAYELPVFASEQARSTKP